MPSRSTMRRGKKRDSSWIKEIIVTYLVSMPKAKRCLNLYAYTGGFSIYALNAGAAKVYSVDVSKKAIDLLNDNVALTDLGAKHESLAQDVTVFLKECPENYYDIIVLDPPAFAKSLRKRHNAVQAYKTHQCSSHEKDKERVD